MSDPRNVAHDKKVKQGKEHKPEAETTAPPNEKGKSAPPAPAAADQSSEDLEKSIALLSKLKEMEFHSRANIETLAELTLTIDDELKQKEFSDPIGRLYSTQDQFHTQIAALIESYEAKYESLKPCGLLWHHDSYMGQHMGNSSKCEAIFLNQSPHRRL